MKRAIILFFTFFSAMSLATYSLTGQSLTNLHSSSLSSLDSEWQSNEEVINLEQALDLISEKYQVFFTYYPEVIRQYEVRMPLLNEIGLPQVLNHLLRSTALNYQQLSPVSYIIAYTDELDSPEIQLDQKHELPRIPSNQHLISVPSITEQTELVSTNLFSNLSLDTPNLVNIRGTVVDEDDFALVGATVQSSADQSIGVVTDIDGNYSINVPDLTGSLLISYVGYETKTVAIANRTVIDIVLSSASETLDEVVVIGYGTRTARDLTGSVSAIDAEEIAKSPALSPEAALQGRLPGVYISTPGGNPGARPEIQIRGIGTFGNAEPLYVIDGVPVTEFASGTEDGREGDLRGTINILSLINPSDIESVSVLKDASAAAIYGVRAANGVILITTKKGQSGAPRISFDASYGWQEAVGRYDVLNTQQFVDLFTDAYANDPNETLPGFFNPSSPDYLGDLPQSDWQEELLNDNAALHNASLRVSGGSASTTYSVSGSYGYQESTLIENNLRRYTFAGNFDSQVSDYIRTGVSFRIGYVEAQDNTRGDLLNAATTSPWQPAFNEDGSPTPVVELDFEPNPGFDANDPASGALFEVANTRLLWGDATRTNPFGEQTTNENDYNIIRNLGSAYLEVEPVKNLRLRGTISADWYSNTQESFIDFNRFMFRQTPDNPYQGHDGTSAGTYSETFTRNWNLVQEISLSYDRSFGAHNFNVLLNAMDQRWTFRGSSITTRQQVSADENLRVATGPNLSTATTGVREINGLQGYMARIGYNFAQRYYLDFTIRRDGSSRFSPENRWGIFPSVAAAWRISDESFLRDSRFVDDLKLRVGWGQLGNQETASFAFLSQVSFTPDYAFGSGNGNPIGSLQFGARLPDLPNANLGWETAETFNIGVDGFVLKNKLNFTFEYYDRLTEGIIQPTSLPLSVGNENQPILNVASVRNSGVELSIGYRDRIGKFTYGFSGNLTTVRNRVESLNGGTAFGGENGRVEEGQPLFYIWGYQTGGIFDSDEEAAAYFEQIDDRITGNTQMGGDVFFQDVASTVTEEDGTEGVIMEPDGIIDAADRVFIGNSIPDHFYGFNFNFGYGNLDLSIFFQGVGGVQRFNFERARGECMCGRGNNNWSTTLDRWTPENTDATLPRAIVSSPGNLRFSDRFVENAGFLRLKNLQIGYNFPVANMGVNFIQSLRLYFTGANLFTLTDWTGIDPEAIQRLGSENIIPPARTFIFGINASF
ncbi:MAG: TonB-dependent receptor [Bacteroidota bacterium]